jgi:hypothetical protein
MRWKTISLVAAAAASRAYRLRHRLYAGPPVQTFSQLSSVPAQAGYRFERCLRSRPPTRMQSALEAMADPALFKAGLRRDDTAPRYGVQVTAREQRVLSPFADPWDYGGWGGAGWGGGFGLSHHGVGIGVGGPCTRGWNSSGSTAR